MPHDAHTFNTCVEMMSLWQDSLMLKLALQPVGNQLTIGHQSVAENFTAKIFMKSVSNRMATVPQSKSVASSLLCMLKRLEATDFVRGPIANHAATFVKPCSNLCNLSPIVIYFS